MLLLNLIDGHDCKSHELREMFECQVNVTVGYALHVHLGILDGHCNIAIKWSLLLLPIETVGPISPKKGK